MNYFHCFHMKREERYEWLLGMNNMIWFFPLSLSLSFSFRNFFSYFISCRFHFSKDLLPFYRYKKNAQVYLLFPFLLLPLDINLSRNEVSAYLFVPVSRDAVWWTLRKWWRSNYWHLYGSLWAVTTQTVKD